MNYFEFKDKLTDLIPDVKYAVLEDVRNCTDGEVQLSGYLFGQDMFSHIYYFRFLKEKLGEVTAMLDGVKINFWKQNSVIHASNGVNVYDNTQSSYNYILEDLNPCIEKTIFELIDIFLHENSSSFYVSEDTQIGLRKIEYATDKFSMYIKYIDNTSQWHTCKLLWYGYKFNIAKDFRIMTEVLMDNELSEYMTEGLISKTELVRDGKQYYLYTVNTEKISIIPVDLDNAATLYSKQMILTAYYELEAYKSFLEGVDLTDKLMKNKLDSYVKNNSFVGQQFSETQTRNFKFMTSRSQFNSKRLVDRMTPYFTMCEDYMDDMNSIHVDEYEQVVSKYLLGDFSNVAKKGALELFRNAATDYAQTKKISNKLKKTYREQMVYLQLYTYYWRAFFLEYTSLLFEYLRISESEITFSGGVYNNTLYISY